MRRPSWPTNREVNADGSITFTPTGDANSIAEDLFGESRCAGCKHLLGEHNMFPGDSDTSVKIYNCERCPCKQGRPTKAFEEMRRVKYHGCTIGFRDREKEREDRLKGSYTTIARGTISIPASDIMGDAFTPDLITEEPEAAPDAS